MTGAKGAQDDRAAEKNLVLEKSALVLELSPGIPPSQPCGGAFVVSLDKKTSIL
jgi:hypothetical protein